MAAIENLEIVVNVDISDALTNLKKLQEELENVANEIRALRRIGSRGFTVQGNVESISDELGQQALLIEAFQRKYGDLSIGMGVDKSIPNGGRGGGGAGSAGLGIMRAFSGMLDGDGFRETFSNLRDSFSDFSKNTAITNINMSDMHNVMARLVPLLIVFVGAIPAAITAVYTLAAAAFTAAAAFAAIAGFGALGVAMEGGELNMQNLVDAFDEVQEAFLDAFAPMANQLEPVFRDGLEGLKRFFQAVANESGALMELTDEARAFGQFIISFVPDALRTLAALVESMSGIFGNMGRFLERNFASVVRTLVGATGEIVPILADLVNRIGRALPALLRMSLGFLMVADGIIRALSAIAQFLNIFGLSPTIIGAVTAALLTFISVAALGSTILGSVFVSSMWSAITSLFTFILSAHGASGALGVLGSTMIGTAATAMVNFVAGLITSIGALFGFTIATWKAAAAAAGLLTLLTLGTGLAIVGLAMSASSAFDSMAGSITSATDALKDFDKVQSGVGTGNFGGDGSNPYKFNPDDPDDGAGGAAGNVTVFNVEGGDGDDEQRSNLEQAAWINGRTTGK